MSWFLFTFDIGYFITRNCICILPSTSIHLYKLQ